MSTRKQSTKKNTEKEPESKVQEVKTVTKAVAKSSSKKGVASKKGVVTPILEEEIVKELSDVEEDVVEDVVEHVVEDVVEDKKRKVPTRDSILESYDQLISTVDEEILRLRESPQKTKGIKFLRSVNKNLKTLRSQSARVMKQRNRPVRKNNNNSGFLKPVQISDEMAKFTGWDVETLRSRVDVTKYLCNYVKENNLQNPADRRQIVADSKLSKLLGYDAKKVDEPLTYYRIQSYIKKHFVKPEPVVAST